MATSQEEQFKRSLQRFLGRSATTGEVEDFKRSGQTSRQAIEGLFGSQGFRELQEGKAKTQFAPVLEGLRGEEAESSLAAQARSRELPEEILGQFSRRGLLRSGGASRSLTEGLAGSARQRALERADIAARRSLALQEQSELVSNLINRPRDQFFQEQQAILEQQLAQEQLELQRQQLELQRKKLGGGGGRGGSGGTAFNSLLTALLGGQQDQQTDPLGQVSAIPQETLDNIQRTANQEQRQKAADALIRLRENQNTPDRSVLDRFLRGDGTAGRLSRAAIGPLGNIPDAVSSGKRAFRGISNAFSGLFGR